MADAEQSNVLREYLIALGFKVDEEKKHKFDMNLVAWDKGATKLSKSLVGVGVAAAALATEFAYRMEKLYYSSKLAESAAGNLAALNFGGKQIGIANMAGQVERFASALRGNPGLIGFLHSLGVKVEGRDKADVFNDLIAATKRFPFYIGQRIAAMFGINPDDLLLMQQGLDKMKEAAKMRKDLASRLGVDVDKAAEDGKEMMNEWRDILTYALLFKDALVIEMLPAMRELASFTKDILETWIRLVKTPREKLVGELRDLAGLPPLGNNGAQLTDSEKQRAAAGSKEPKRREDMSPEMQRQRGMDPDFVPYEEATPEERHTLYDKPTQWINNALQYYGLKSAGGGVELSEDSKKRLGLPQSTGTASNESKTVWRRGIEKLYEKLGHPQAMPRTPDAASIDAVTEPDRVQLARERGQQPDVAETLAGGLAPLPGADKAPADKQSLMKQLELKYALPAGLLDRIWFKEASRRNDRNIYGPVTKSGERAEGPAQFMPGTAKQYGVKDTQDFGDAMGGAAHKMSDLLKKYGGDLRFAAAAYNWGDGNLDKAIAAAMAKFPMASQSEIDRYVLGVLPDQTKDYVNTVAGGQGTGAQVTIHQENNYNIHESGSARDTAREIGEQQRVINADTVRQFTPRVQ